MAEMLQHHIKVGTYLTYSVLASPIWFFRSFHDNVPPFTSLLAYSMQASLAFLSAAGSSPQLNGRGRLHLML